MDDKMIMKASRMLKILADPTRLRILMTLEETEYNVTELAGMLGLEQSALSHQLKVLKAERLVKSRRAGRSMYYAPDDTHIYTILDQIRDHMAEGVSPQRASSKETEQSGRVD